jgi:hypothetical protein
MPKTITKLYAEFEKALAAMEALPYPLRETREKEYDAALDLCTTLCDRIVDTRADPANPVSEMLMKIAAAGWGYGTSEPLDRWTSCPDGDIVDCVVSLREDLLAMQAAPPRRAKRSAVRTRVGAQPVV